MKKNIPSRIFCFLCLLATLLFASLSMNAQDPDQLKTRTVDVTSQFKPSLREPSKINFAATPPPTDTSRPRLSYSIPNQNLQFAYQPGNVRPLALSVDSGGRWDGSSYVKAGFGSLRTPYVETGISFGDGRNMGFNIYADHVASEAKEEFKKFSRTRARFEAFYKNARNMEWNGSIGFKQNNTFKYGFLPTTLTFLKDSLKQSFSTIGGRIGFHNIQATELGLSYAPELKIDVFSDNHKNNESNTVLDLPLEKTIGEKFSVDLGITFDLTRYSPNAKDVVNNTMYYISPSVKYKTPNLMISGGVRPSWDNSDFHMYPNVAVEFTTTDQKFSFQAGWTGYIRKTSYQYLAGINPWLYAPDSLKNSKIEENYAGIKGSVGSHFSYSAKAGFKKIIDQPLFVNVYPDGKSFQVVNESFMRVFNLGGELGYTVGEKFSLIAGVTVNHYGDLKDNARAWGLVPVEGRGSLRLLVLKDLYLTADAFTWTGIRYMKEDPNDRVGKLTGSADLNAGLEFKVTRNLKAWTQFNNIFNREYAMWSQYNSFGFNFVGGIIFTFDQKN